MTAPALLKAMRQVPRHLFVQKAMAPHAYEDAALPIGYGQTISQPYMVARLTELLCVEPGMRVLEVGSGCGYQAAVLSAMGCTVFGIERIREICHAAAARLRGLRIPRAQFYHGDGTLGLPMAAPFERIMVSAGGPEIPQPLLDQLDNNGIMIMPVGRVRRDQRLMRIRKINMRVITEDMGKASFVELIGEHGW